MKSAPEGATPNLTQEDWDQIWSHKFALIPWRILRLFRLNGNAPISLGTCGGESFILTESSVQVFNRHMKNQKLPYQLAGVKTKSISVRLYKVPEAAVQPEQTSEISPEVVPAEVSGER